MEQIKIRVTVLNNSTTDKDAKKKRITKLDKVKKTLTEDKERKENKEKWKQEITAAQQKDWQDIEDLVILYQKQFDKKTNLSVEEAEEAKMAGW